MLENGNCVFVFFCFYLLIFFFLTNVLITKILNKTIHQFVYGFVMIIKRLSCNYHQSVLIFYPVTFFYHIFMFVESKCYALSVGQNDVEHGVQVCFKARKTSTTMLISFEVTRRPGLPGKLGAPKVHGVDCSDCIETQVQSLTCCSSTAVLPN